MGSKNKKISKSSQKGAAMRISQRTIKSRRERRMLMIARRLALSVIILSMLVVILMVLFMSFTKPEKVVTQKIEEISVDYYENYFYDRIKSYDNLDAYVENGFSRVSLRQLLLFDSERHADAASLLNQYCDSEKTYIRIYPEEPFSKTDYHIEYNYACTF